MRTRRDRDQQRLDAGTVTSPKELESLQSEIASLQRRQSVLEDAELEVMERLDDAQREVAALTAERESVGQRMQEVQAARDTVWAEIDAEADAARAERTGLAADIPSELLSLYEKIRAERAGIGAAALRQRRCEGCRMQLDPVEVARIRGLDADEVVRHDECRRILVRVADSGL